MALYRDIDFRTGSALDKLGANPTMAAFIKNTDLGLAVVGGNNKYINYDRQLIPDGTCSIVTWARVPDNFKIGYYNATIISYTTNRLGFAISYDDGSVGRPLIYLVAGGQNRYFNYAPDRKWHCWIFILTGANASDFVNSKLFVDAAEKSAYNTISTGTPTPRSSFTYVGGSILGGIYDGAIISRIKVYDTVLTTAEINREQEEFEQARALTRQSICSFPMPDGTTLDLHENWKYLGVGNKPQWRGEWIKGTGVYTVQQLTADSGIKKKGDFYLKCNTAGTLNIPFTKTSGLWEFEVLKGADANRIDIEFISNKINPFLGQFDGYYLSFFSDERLGLNKSISPTAFAVISGVAGSLSNNVWYKVRIYRLGNTTGKFPKRLTGDTTYAAWSWLLTVQGGTYVNETVVVGNANDNNIQTSKYLVIDADVNDLIGDVKHFNTWSL